MQFAMNLSVFGVLGEVVIFGAGRWSVAKHRTGPTVTAE
jgi:hypothetical protein